MRIYSHTRSWRTEILVSASLHVDYDIQEFFLASLALGFRTALSKAAKSLSSLIGVVGGQRGIHTSRPKYLAFFLRVTLQRHPRTM